MPCRLRLLVAIAMLLLPAPAQPQSGSSPDQFTDAWRWVHFTRTSGLASDFVVSVVDVTDDGLWAITRDGVSRFDGFVWKTVHGTRDIGTQTATLTPDGRGGVVLVSGGRVFVGRASGLRPVAATDGNEPTIASACARAGRGPVLVTSRDGLLYDWDGEALHRHRVPDQFGRVRSLRQAGAAVWASTETGLWCWEGTRWRQRLAGRELVLLAVFEHADESALAYVDSPRSARGLWEWQGESGPRPIRRTVSTPVESIAVGPAGVTLITHNTGELVQRAGDEWTSFKYAGMSIMDARSAGFLSNGDLWIATDHGLFIYRRSRSLWRALAIPRPDDRNTVNAILPLADGRLLLGTGRGIAEATVETPVADKPMRREDEIGAVTGLAVDGRGRVWATSGYTFTGARWRDTSGRWTLAHLDPVLDAVYLHRVVSDRHGGVWFLGLSFDPMTGIARMTDGPGAFHLVVSADGSEPDRVDRWTPAQGLPSGRVYGFAEGPDGEYWFATAGGLSRWRKGAWTHWDSKSQLKLDRVFSVAVDRQGDVWFGHQAWLGVGRIHQDQVKYFTEKDGLATDAVWEIGFDYRNNPWVAGEGGVSMYADGAWTAFGPESGLTHTRFWPVASSGEHICIGSRGGGLTVLSLSERRTPPPIVVPEQPAQDESGFVVRWHAFAWWGELPPGAVQTRIRLDREPWSRWSTEREARFAGLHPGVHTIAFESKGPLGGKNASVPSLRFQVPPPLIARPVFFVPVAALSVLALGLLNVLVARQRRHHQDLHEREQQLTRTFQASPLATSVVDLERGTFLDVNQAMVRLTGKPREELVGQVPGDGFLLEDARRRVILDALAAGRRIPPVPLSMRCGPNDVRDLVAYVEGVDFAGTRAVLCQMLDVTEQKRLEGQLRQAQKMESIGRLAGGVAHDFNNLLTVILGNASLLDVELPEGDPRHNELEQITIAGERAERLTRQLLAFARKQVVEPKVVNINDVIAGTHRMLQRLIGEDVELVMLPDAGLDLVLIDPTQLEQVLMNLSVNARDAMPSGGTLTIRTQNVTISEREARLQPEASPGRFVRLSIADTGTGMDAATQARLFEPFFTTKEPGKGTGLGLATCYGIVRQAGGHILLESALGRGSTFHVDLPPAPVDRLSHDPRERQVDARGGAETILLVEDEVQVRALAASVLRHRGYQVLEAGTGIEALEVADRYRGRLDILVTDIVMPHMRGTELARRLRTLRPGVRVLYVSGYTDDDRFRQEAGADRVAFLGKPFTPAALARKVREILDEEGGAAAT
jgi:two-component system, cell cycle sensor histidine kinase and response regulator CckA